MQPWDSGGGSSKDIGKRRLGMTLRWCQRAHAVLSAQPLFPVFYFLFSTFYLLTSVVPRQPGQVLVGGGVAQLTEEAAEIERRALEHRLAVAIPVGGVAIPRQLHPVEVGIMHVDRLVRPVVG